MDGAEAVDVLLEGINARVFGRSLSGDGVSSA